MLKYLLAALLCWAALPHAAQDGRPLARKASLGIQPQPGPEGVLVGALSEGGTAAALGLQPGDLLLALNGQTLGDINTLVQMMGQYRAGDACEWLVRRGTAQVRLSGTFLPRPYETSPFSDVIYDQAAYKNGQLRVIINKPRKDGPLPALLFVPGYACTSLDNLPDEHPYKRLIDAYVQAGFVVLRIEKSGLGDSYNTPACESCDLLDEIENFQVGLDKLKSLPYVDSSKVFVYGHSMGGIVAPALAANNRLAGLVVYGTTAKSWFEYQIEMYRTQGLLGGADPLAHEAAVREMYELCYRFFIQKEALSSIAKDSLSAELLRTQWMYDAEQGMIFGRNAEYWRQIQDYPHLENWKQTEAKVLVQFGESDFQAFSLADHQQIEWTVNYFHPSSARLIRYPQTDHFFAKSGTMQDAYDKFVQGRYQELFDNFNPAVAEDAVAWSLGILDAPADGAAKAPAWRKLDTAPYPGKQDDIYFIDEKNGWYVNGFGRIYRTQNGGDTWEKVYEKEGTFFRTIAFLDENVGFAGTVGTDYFPNVIDTVPLYRTDDGGKSWSPVDYSGPYVKGLCAIAVVKEPYINHGTMAYKTHLYAVGRVGSPANIITSHDGGQTWASRSMGEDAQMLFDIVMLDKDTGFACAASSANIQESNALILKTTDGGRHWRKVYQSDRPFETTWKAAFPSRQVGYVTIQSYNPDPQAKQQRLAKSTDGGETWTEIDLVEDAGAREFGIGFIDEQHGFVGTMNSAYETKDGGQSWSPLNLGRACNKIRIYQDGGRFYGYAIGLDVFKMN